MTYRRPHLSTAPDRSNPEESDFERYCNCGERMTIYDVKKHERHVGSLNIQTLELSVVVELRCPHRRLSILRPFYFIHDREFWTSVDNKPWQRGTDIW